MFKIKSRPSQDHVCQDHGFQNHACHVKIMFVKTMSFCHDHVICFQYDPIWSILIQFDTIWSNLIYIWSYMSKIYKLVIFFIIVQNKKNNNNSKVILRTLAVNARSQKCTYVTFLSLHSKLDIETDMLFFLLHRSQLQREKVHEIHRFSILEKAYIIISL